MNCPYCDKQFKSWKSVRGHISHCNDNNGEYFIDLAEGPLHYTKFLGKNNKQVLKEFPKLVSSLGDITKSFKSRNIPVDTFVSTFSKTEVIHAIQIFVKQNNRVPSYREVNNLLTFPSMWVINKYFGTLNEAIKIAGFNPNLQNGYGTRTCGLDGHLYRSQAEAYFANKHLYNQYKYDIEPKYPKPYDGLYDWYIYELDLYIELDGGLRPIRIKEKIKINKKLNRQLVIIPTNKIDNIVIASLNRGMQN